jgi:hypothetical protein
MPYHIEQRIEGELQMLERAMNSLSKLNNLRDTLYKKIEEELREEGKDWLVDNLYLGKKKGDILYFLASDRVFPKVKEAWNDLIGLIRGNKFWWADARGVEEVVEEEDDKPAIPIDVEKVREFRDKFLKVTSTLRENLAELRELVEKFLECWPFNDPEDLEIQLTKEWILRNIRAAQYIIEETCKYAGPTPPQPEEEKGTPTAGAVQGAIKAIKDALLRLLGRKGKMAEGE